MWNESSVEELFLNADNFRYTKFQSYHVKIQLISVRQLLQITSPQKIQSSVYTPEYATDSPETLHINIRGSSVLTIIFLVLGHMKC